MNGANEVNPPGRCAPALYEKMKTKIETLHLIIGFGLILCVPIAEMIGNDVSKLIKITALVYWVLVAITLLTIGIINIIKEKKIKLFIFKSWLFLSMLAGLFGVYTIIMYGVINNLWTFLLFIYSGIIWSLFKKEIKNL